jgi:methyl-accepting chemotaxis protein
MKAPNITLAFRLSIATFVLPVIVSALITGLGYFQLKGSNARLDYFLVTTVPGVELLQRIRYDFSRIDSTLGKMIVGTEPGDPLPEANLEEIAILGEGLEILFEKYRTEYVADADDATLTETDAQNIAAYFLMQEKYIELAKINGRFAEYLMSGANIEASAQLNRSLKAHISDSLSRAAKYQEEGRELAERNFLTQIATGGIAALILILVGTQTFRYTLRTLGGDPLRASNAVGLIASGDLSSPMMTRYPESLISKLESMRVSLKQSIEQLHKDSKTLSVYAESLASSSHQVASGANDGSDNASRMAATSEEMTINIANVSQNALTVAATVKLCGEVAIRGGSNVVDLINSMSLLSTRFKESTQNVVDLEGQSNQIRSIVEEIKDIAEQTDLLALNASIEAARAGDSGRGFAVVANEVRKLAERTKLSTVDIASKIRAIQTNVHAVMSNMQSSLEEVDRSEGLALKADSAVKEIQDTTNNAVSLVSEISKAIAESSEITQQVAKSVESFASLSEENSVAAKEVALTATELSKLAESLQSLTSTFKTS